MRSRARSIRSEAETTRPERLSVPLLNAAAMGMLRKMMWASVGIGAWRAWKGNRAKRKAKGV